MRASSLARHPYTTTILGVAAVAVIAAGIGRASSAPAGRGGAPSGGAARPNILLVVADDMRFDDLDRVADLKPGGGFDWVRANGTRFPKLQMTNNLCCPGRATLLTGQTSRNHGIRTNDEFRDFRSGTFPVLLEDAGYCTGFTGKYLNTYDSRRPRPAGWTFWEPLNDHFDDETGYSMLNRRGEVIQPGTFITRRLGQVAAGQLTDCLDAGKPAMVALLPFAPHRKSTPEPAYSQVAVPWGNFDPSFNEFDLSDKPAWLQARYPAQVPDAGVRAALQTTNRVRSLLSLDDALRKLLDELAGRGELANTVVVLTSDNGYLLFEHRIPPRKAYAYEAGQPAAWIAGPKFPAGVTIPAYATNLDFAPTIIRAAGVETDGGGAAFDGRPLQRVLRDPELGRARFLPLYVPTDPVGEGVRTNRYKYIEYTDGSRELYDLAVDPFEERNVAGNLFYARIEKKVSKLAARAESCREDSCRERAPLALQ